MKEISEMIEEDYRNQDAAIDVIDRKLQQKIAEKKEAQGIKIG